MHLPAVLSRIADKSESFRRFQITGLSKRPSFARLRFGDGSLSAPSVITLVDALRESVREARGRRAESAAAQLADETEEGLWLLEVLNDLEAAEAAQNDGDNPGVRRTRKQTGDNTSESDFQTLDYKQFIAGRRLRSEDQIVSRNSLAGSELSLVRNFMNRILSIGHTPIDNADPLHDKLMAEGLDLGDETSDAEGAVESGEEFSKKTEAAYEQADEEIKRKKAAKARATREQISQAVGRFNKQIREKAKAELITSFDVLRLRAILTIVAAAGLPSVIKKTANPEQTSLQVLPLDESGESWPMLMGRVLFTFFGSKHPAIHHVQIEAIHDQIPDDILECWATCLWAVQACAIAVDSHRKLAQNSRRIISLLQNTYALTGLRSDELQGEKIGLVFANLNARFAKRLGLDSEKMEQAHARLSHR